MEKILESSPSEDLYSLLREIHREKRNRRRVVLAIGVSSIALLGLALWTAFQLGYLAEAWPLMHPVEPVKPMTTDLAVLGPREVGHLQKRFAWYLGVILYRAVGLGFAALGIYTSCHAYNDDGGVLNGALCVAGVVTTAVTIGGYTYAYLAKKGAEAGEIAASGIELGTLGNPTKRSESMPMDDFINMWNDKITDHPVFQHRLHGFIHRNNTRHGHLIPEGHDSWPVFHFKDLNGYHMHHMVFTHPTGKIVSRIGPASAPSQKRDSFNNEYFDNGGVDFYACDGGDGNNLNAGDFAGVEDNINCAVGSLDEVSDFDYQINDSDDGQIVGSGQVAGVGSDGSTNLRSNDQCPSGVGGENQCGTHDSSGVSKS